MIRRRECITLLGASKLVVFFVGPTLPQGGHRGLFISWPRKRHNRRAGEPKGGFTSTDWESRPAVTAKEFVISSSSARDITSSIQVKPLGARSSTNCRAASGPKRRLRKVTSSIIG